MHRPNVSPPMRFGSGRAAWLLALALLVGCSTGETDVMAGTPTAEAPGTTTTVVPPKDTLEAAPSTPTQDVPSLPEEAPVSYPVGVDPVSIEIPAIGVAADTIQMDLAGPVPEVPTDFDQTGWYQQTRRPGEIGPAIIAGHIDSTAGPAVFAQLDRLEPGDEIIVRDDDGQQRTFVVTRAGQYPKGDLPPEVFGFDQPVPELRLITCGGSFDQSTGHYRDNYVVYAVSDQAV